jgi:flagellar biosynthetic protein FliP
MRWVPALALVLWAAAARAQDVTVSLGQGGELGSTAIGLIALITLLSLVPGLAMMVTCFPMVVTVLSILRQAIGLQQAPPNMVVVSLALFLSYFVMEPVAQRAWTEGVSPYLAGTVELADAIAPTYAPFRDFMQARVDGDVLARLQDLRGTAEVTPAVLVPSFLLSEIARAFQIGFLVFLPFMIIDLIVAAVLMSMGMMMVPPAVVSLPFKLAFFVIADGWTLVSEALVRGYL